MSSLDIDEPEKIIYLQNGFITSDKLKTQLEIIARVYSGTFTMRKGEGNVMFSGDGYYDSHNDSWAFEKALREADVNGDKLITKEETGNLLSKVQEEYAE